MLYFTAQYYADARSGKMGKNKNGESFDEQGSKYRSKNERRPYTPSLRGTIWSSRSCWYFNRERCTDRFQDEGEYLKCINFWYKVFLAIEFVEPCFLLTEWSCTVAHGFSRRSRWRCEDIIVSSSTRGWSDGRLLDGATRGSPLRTRTSG